jgi:hypothetical protein
VLLVCLLFQLFRERKPDAVVITPPTTPTVLIVQTHEARLAVLIVQANEARPDVYVDGEKMPVVWVSGGKRGEIKVKPGKHKVEVKKEGFLVFGKEVVLGDSSRETLTATLAPVSFPTHEGGTGNVRVEGEALVLDDLEHIPACANVYFGDKQWVDYDFQVDVKRLAGSTHCGLWFRHSDVGNQWCYSFGKGSHLITLENLLGFTWRGGIQADVGPIGNDNWYTLRVSVRGSEFQCFVDGRLTFSGTRQAHPQGCVGFHVNGSRFAFRNITVTAPDGKVMLAGLPDIP